MDTPFTFIRWDRWDAKIICKPYVSEIAVIHKAMDEIMWESTERVTVIDKRTGETIFNEPGTFA